MQSKCEWDMQPRGASGQGVSTEACDAGRGLSAGLQASNWQVLATGGKWLVCPAHGLVTARLSHRLARDRAWASGCEGECLARGLEMRAWVPGYQGTRVFAW